MQNTWQSSDDLTNFFINKKSTKKSLISGAYDKKTDICCFSHVPKTAGTSLESVIAKNFQPSEVLHINAPDLNRLMPKNHGQNSSADITQCMVCFIN